MADPLHRSVLEQLRASRGNGTGASHISPSGDKGRSLSIHPRFGGETISRGFLPHCFFEFGISSENVQQLHSRQEAEFMQAFLILPRSLSALNKPKQRLALEPHKVSGLPPLFPVPGAGRPTEAPGMGQEATSTCSRAGSTGGAGGASGSSPGRSLLRGNHVLVGPRS